MSNLDALFLISGDHSEDDVPRKTSAVQVSCSFLSLVMALNQTLCPKTWLLGYEFPSTFILMERNRVTFLCSSSKGICLPPRDE